MISWHVVQHLVAILILINSASIYIHEKYLFSPLGPQDEPHTHFWGGVETIKLQLSWFWAYTVFQYFQIKPPLPSVWGCATRKWQCLSRYLSLSAHFSFRWVCHKPQEGGKGFHPASHTRHWALYIFMPACWYVHRKQPLWLSLYHLWSLIQNKWSQGGEKYYHLGEYQE